MNKIGETKFLEYGKGWYDLDYTLNHTNTNADRYAIYGYLPFYMINQMYNDAYEKDDDIGSTYDWLNDYPTEKEIDWFNNINFDRCTDFQLTFN